MSLNESQDQLVDQIPKNHIPCKVVTIDGRNYLELKLYNDKTYLFGQPDKRVLDLYNENKFEYIFRPEDNNWHKFLNNIKRRKVYALAKQVNRSKALVNGEIQDIYWIFLSVHGTNIKDEEESDSRVLGVWRMPKFKKERDQNTEEWKTIGVDNSRRIFEFTLNLEDKESIESLRYFVKRLHPEGQLNIAMNIDGKSDPILDIEGFASATFPELVELGQRRGLTLSEMREMKSFYQNAQKLKQR